MAWSNYHQHCHYCDGTLSVEEHVREAIGQSMISMGFSCHCPVPFENNWSMKMEDVRPYLNEIALAKEKFAGEIELYRSLEIDYIPGMIDVNEGWIQAIDLDYSVGSVHFVGAYENGRPWEIDGPHNLFLEGLDRIYRGDVGFIVRKYFELTREMVRNACPDVVGHLDKIKMQNHGFWDENASWYQQEILKTLEEIKAAKAIVEVNTRGLYKKLTHEPYPGKWVLEQIYKMNIPIHINSDAHHPREITNHFSEVAGMVKNIGFKHLWMLRERKWQPVAFNEQGLILG
jgi:histidinol-phosphatase (PHP family)